MAHGWRMKKLDYTLFALLFSVAHNGVHFQIPPVANCRMFYTLSEPKYTPHRRNVCEGENLDRIYYFPTPWIISQSSTMSMQKDWNAPLSVILATVIHI